MTMTKSRTPAAQAGANAAAPATRAGGSARPRRLAGQLGAEVAALLSTALERVEALGRSGRIDRHGLRALEDEIRRARRTAMLGQQASRLAGGHGRQSPEVLELPQLVREALAQRRGALSARGLEVRQRLQPCTVAADPSLLFTLLLSLLDWAFEHSRAQTVLLATGMQAWPAHPLLECRFAWRAPDRQTPPRGPAEAAEALARGDDPARLDTVAWHLVEQAAATMGAHIVRSDTPWQVQMQLVFADPPRRWPRLVETAADAAQPLAGVRLLVFAQRAEVRQVVQQATATLGMRVTHARTLLELRARGLATPPDVLLVDERGGEVDRVLTELAAGGRGPALVQVAEAFRGLEVSTCAELELLRVARDSALRDLPAALAYALSR